jgi:hypothetical protein
MVNQGLSEAQRENIYWRITQALLLSTPLLIAVVAKNYPVPNVEIFAREMPYLLPLGFGAIIAAMIFEIFISPERKFWIKRPSVTVEYAIRGDPKRWLERHFKLLNEAGFFYSANAEGRQWRINKNKSGSVHSFNDHAFSGAVAVTEDNFGARASITLVFEDVVVIETGEFSKLDRLAHSLLGDETSDVEKGLPLTACCAVILGIASHAFFYAELIYKINLPGFAAAFLAFGEALWMTAVILIKQKELIGLRITIAMIAAGGAPFIGLAAALL